MACVAIKNRFSNITKTKYTENSGVIIRDSSNTSTALIYKGNLKIFYVEYSLLIIIKNFLTITN